MTAAAIGASSRPRPRMRGLARRRGTSILMVGLTCAAAAAAIVPLVAILAYLLRQGASALSLDFFTNMPRPVGEPGGGMANAIIGTLILIGIASAGCRSGSARGSTSPSAGAPSWRTSCASWPTC
jgi:hypothetical protein